MSACVDNEDIENFIQETIQKECLTNYFTDVSRATKNGDGYMSVVDLLSITGITKQGKNKHLSYIIKKCINNKSLREQMSMLEAYRQEINAYENIFTKFIEYQQKRNVKQLFIGFPKCYKTSVKLNEECLLLENLKESGFRLYHGKDLMDSVHVSLVLKTYARFHALSFAIKQQNPEMWDGILSGFDGHFFRQVFERNNMTSIIIDQILKLEGRLKGKPSIANALRNYRTNINDLFYAAMEGGNPKYFTVVHGDCWFNNMMFKYDANDTPTDVRLLDFQACRLASPALDLCYFIYSGSPKEILNNLDNYLHLYHDTLCSFLKELGCEDDLYPFVALKEDWKACSLFGLGISFLILRGIYTDREKLPEFTTLADSGDDIFERMMDEMEDSDIAFDKYEDIVQHFIDCRLLHV